MIIQSAKVTRKIFSASFTVATPITFIIVKVNIGIEILSQKLANIDAETQVSCISMTVQYSTSNFKDHLKEYDPLLDL